MSYSSPDGDACTWQRHFRCLNYYFSMEAFSSSSSSSWLSWSCASASSACKHYTSGGWPRVQFMNDVVVPFLAQPGFRSHALKKGAKSPYQLYMEELRCQLRGTHIHTQTLFDGLVSGELQERNHFKIKVSRALAICVACIGLRQEIPSDRLT